MIIFILQHRSSVPARLHRRKEHVREQRFPPNPRGLHCDLPIAARGDPLWCAFHLRHLGPLALQLRFCKWKDILPCRLDLLQSLLLLWSPPKLHSCKGDSVVSGRGHCLLHAVTTKGVLKAASERNKLLLPTV